MHVKNGHFMRIVLVPTEKTNRRVVFHSRQEYDSTSFVHIPRSTVWDKTPRPLSAPQGLAHVRRVQNGQLRFETFEFRVSGF